MRVQPVFAELFTVIGGHDHDRVVEDTSPSQLIEQPADLLIDGGDGSVVLAAEVPRPWHGKLHGQRR